MAEPVDMLQRLADRAAIHDLVARYAQCIDRRDWPALRDIFHPDATDDHGSYQGGIEGFFTWVQARHELIDESMHFLGNCLVEQRDADTALAETYFCAYLRVGPQAVSGNANLLPAGADAPLGYDILVRGRYIDRVERRAGPWKVASRVTAFEAIDSRPATGPRGNPDHRWSARTRTDALFEARQALFGNADQRLPAG